MAMMNKAGQLVLGIAGLTIPLLVGCATNGGTAREWQEIASFVPSEDLPKIVVYGDLGSHLPRFNPTPALDEFLYGPAPVVHTILRNPQSVALLNDRLLVCDQGYLDIVSINLASGRSTIWSDRERAPRCPVAIVSGQDGMIYVADTTLRSVLVYSPNGDIADQLTLGDDTQGSFRPAALLMGDGILYVGNLAGRRVERWSTIDRQWLSPIVPPPESLGFVAPTGLAMTDQGTLLIVDSIRSRILRVSPEGEWLEPISRPGRQQGELVRPKRVAVTPSGLIVVTDAGRQSVMIFTADGRYVTEIREQTDEWPGFTLPTGLLTLPAEGLAPLMPEGRPMPEPMPDEWIVVTDSLNAASLNLLGVFLPEPTEAASDAVP